MFVANEIYVLSMFDGSFSFRIRNWWHPVVSLLLGAVYLCIYYYRIPFLPALELTLYFLLLSALTATLGYYLNDITDLPDDLLVKKTRSPEHPGAFRISLTIILLLAGIAGIAGIACLLKLSFVPAVLLLFQLLLFILYSLPPLRLKRFWLPALAIDSLYNSSVFILLIITHISERYGMGMPDPLFLGFVLTLFLLKGVRNYTDHILNDRKSDTALGRKTLVAKTGISKAICMMQVIIVLETVLFIWVFWWVKTFIIWALAVFVCLYFIRVMFLPIIKKQYKRLNRYVLLIMNDFYEEWIPVAALLLLGVQDYRFIFLLLIHMFLFRNFINKLFEGGHFIFIQIKQLANKINQK
jgi:4-hydroxybenzoate polyprenyltransferase